MTFEHRHENKICSVCPERLNERVKEWECETLREWDGMRVRESESVRVTFEHRHEMKTKVVQYVPG